MYFFPGITSSFTPELQFANDFQPLYSNLIQLKLNMGKEEDLKPDVLSLDWLIGEIHVTCIGHVSTVNP